MISASEAATIAENVTTKLNQARINAFLEELDKEIRNVSASGRRSVLISNPRDMSELNLAKPELEKLGYTIITLSDGDGYSLGW